MTPAVTMGIIIFLVSTVLADELGEAIVVAIASPVATAGEDSVTVTWNGTADGDKVDEESVFDEVSF